MRRAMELVACTVLGTILTGCGDGGGNGDGGNALAYLGLAEDTIWTYDIEYQAFTLAGEVRVVQIDRAYVEGVEAYKLELRQNQNQIAYLWYQVTSQGLFLLGEEVKEQSRVMERTFLEPIQAIPYPLESGSGIPVQSWRTESEMEQGGSETHRFDNQGKLSLTVPAGSFEAFHLVHTRTTADGTFAYQEYFSPTNWYPQFENPEGYVWKLTSREPPLPQDDTP